MRQRIVDAADRLFYGQGIQAVGVDAVCAAAGVSKRTLYKYFPSKDELVAAYLARRAAAIPEGEGPPLDQILSLFDGLEKWFASKRFRGCPFVNAVSELSGDRSHPAVAVAVNAKKRRREWFEKKLHELGIAHTAVVADQLVIVFEGAIAASLVRGGDPETARAAKDVARAVLDAAGVAAK
jgi:AcrR family transcriptional regulator